jgi:HJR/Mrr/RecB family endonuclease
MNYVSKKHSNDFNKFNIILKCLITIYIIGFFIKLFNGYFELCSLIFLIGILIYKSPGIIHNLKNKKNNLTQEQIKLMLSAFTPRQFELFTYELFKGLGYNTYLMPNGPDGGKDVILNGKIYVECKRYNSRIV